MKSLQVAFSTAEAEEEEGEVQLLQGQRLSGSVDRNVCGTSGFGHLQQHSDQLGDVKVGGVVQSVHVGPAAPQTHVGAQRDQLTAETKSGGRVTCVHVHRMALSEPGP